MSSANIELKLVGFIPVSTKCFIILHMIRYQLFLEERLPRLSPQYRHLWTSYSQTWLSYPLPWASWARRSCPSQGKGSSHQTREWYPGWWLSLCTPWCPYCDLYRALRCVMMTASMARAAPSTASMLTASAVHSVLMHPGTNQTAHSGRGLALLSVSSRCFSALSSSLLSSSSARSCFLFPRGYWLSILLRAMEEYLVGHHSGRCHCPCLRSCDWGIRILRDDHVRPVVVWPWLLLFGWARRLLPCPCRRLHLVIDRHLLVHHRSFDVVAHLQLGSFPRSSQGFLCSSGRLWGHVGSPKECWTHYSASFFRGVFLRHEVRNPASQRITGSEGQCSTGFKFCNVLLELFVECDALFVLDLVSHRSCGLQ